MNRERIRLIIQLLLYVGLATLAAAPVLAQVPVDEDGNPVAPLEQEATLGDYDDEELPILSITELEDIVGPVALYPDDLLAIVLPASTYPLQVVQAARFLERLEADPSLKPDEAWDESITALLNYPEVVDLMNEDIDWTWRLGEAVVAQQADVIAAVESFRDKAYAAGNLKSDERQTVSNEDGVIEIEPVNEDVIYVPYYEPESVVVYQPRPVYHYYPHAYPLYYYPYPYGHSFGSGYFWGVTTAFTIGWLTDHLHVYHHSFWGHPYYGHHYYNHHFYRRSSLSHYNHYYVHNSHNYWNFRYRDGDFWRPARHGGARPGHHEQRVHYYRDRSRDDWRHRGHDGNVSDRDRRDNNGDRQASNRGNPGERRDHSSSRTSGRNVISFQSRDARARADQERRRTRALKDLNRNSLRSTSFAAIASRSSASSNSRRSNTSRTARPSTPPRTSTRSSHDRSRQVAMNNPRRHIPPAAPRQASNPSFQRPPARSQPQRSAPQHSAQQHSAPQRSNPPRSAAPPSAPQPSAGSGHSSSSSSHGSSSRGESRSRRRH